MEWEKRRTEKYKKGRTIVSAWQIGCFYPGINFGESIKTKISNITLTRIKENLRLKGSIALKIIWRLY